MTAFLSANTTGSRESRTLDSTKVGGKSFANKDFEKNIAFLNNAVDTHTQFLQKLQSGVDDSNQNVLEQVQGFWGDLFTLFAGFTPTGIDIGDVKYVIQGIGAFFGVNPDTPFPLNLFEAAAHFLTTYIIPLDQFTDVIFDAILAWAIDFGLSESFINSIRELMDAVAMLGETFSSLFDSLGELLSAFGFLNWTSTSGLGELWDTLVNLIDGLALEPLKPVLNLLADLGVPFINALTGIISGATSLLIPFTQIIKGSPNFLVSPGFTDSDSFVNTQGWTRDAFVGRTFEGSAKATAGSVVRELLSDPAVAVSEGQKIESGIYVSWSGASYTGTNHAQLTIRAYSGTTGQTPVSQTIVQAITFTGTAQATWQRLSGTYTVPAGVTFIRVSLKVPANVATGNVWFDDASAKRNGGFLSDLFSGIQSLFSLSFLDDLIGINPFAVWGNVITGKLNPLELLEDFGIRGLVQNFIDAMISVIRGIPFVGGFLATLVEDLTGWFTDTEHTAAIASDAKMGLQATQDILVSGITASTQTGVNDSQVQTAVNSQTATIISQGAALEAITSQLNAATNSGITQMDDFEYVNVGDMNPLIWQRFILSGTAPAMDTSDGHNATSVANGDVLYRYIGPNPHTLSNYQRVTATIASQMGQAGFGDGRRPRQSVFCRVSDDGTKWVRLYWTNQARVVVDYRNGASYGELYNSGEFANWSPGAGSNMTIEPGVGIDQWKFRIWKGNTPIQIVNDGSHVTDPTPLGTGIGMFRDAAFGSGAFTQFTASDNAPSLVLGTVMEAFRANASTQGINGQVPNGFWDTVDKISADLTFNATTGEVTVAKAGSYMINICARDLNGLTGGQSLEGAVYVNGVLRRRSVSLTSGSGVTTFTPTCAIINTTLYLNAGDVVRAGVISPNHGFFGDAGGTQSYFHMVKIT